MLEYPSIFKYSFVKMASSKNLELRAISRKDSFADCIRKSSETTRETLTKVRRRYSPIFMAT